MANTITGKVKEIRPLVSMVTKSGTNFQKQDLVLDCSRYDQQTGQKFENYVCVTFAQKNIEKLMGLAIGTLVTVTFSVEGRYYAPKDSYFTDIRGFDVEIKSQAPVQQPAPQQMPQHQYQQPRQPAPQYGQPAQQYYAQAPQYPLYQQQAPNPNDAPF